MLDLSKHMKPRICRDFTYSHMWLFQRLIIFTRSSFLIFWPSNIIFIMKYTAVCPYLKLYQKLRQIPSQWIDNQTNTARCFRISLVVIWVFTAYFSILYLKVSIINIFSSQLVGFTGEFWHRVQIIRFIILDTQHFISDGADISYLPVSTSYFHLPNDSDLLLS